MDNNGANNAEVIGIGIPNGFLIDNNGFLRNNNCG